MRIQFFITKEMKEKLWLESGRVVNQRQEIELEPCLLSPEVRKALGAVSEFQIPLEDAFSVDPEHKEVLTDKIIEWLKGEPARKEKLNLKYRLEDLEKKSENLQRRIKRMENELELQKIKSQGDYEDMQEEARNLRAQADEVEDAALKQKQAWTKTEAALMNELSTDLKPALAETLSLMDKLRAQYDEL